MRKLVVTSRPLDSLTPYARNARTHSDAQVEQIAASIREFGWTNPVLVDEEGGIIAGHGRVMAARLLGQAKVPTITLTGLSEAQKRAYVLADNQLALNAGWNEELLKLELKDLVGKFDLALTGFSAQQLEDLIGEDAPVRDGETDPDDVPEVAAKAITAVGQIWQLGRHRLICADATEAASYRQVMEEKAHLVWTDPPYNVAYEGAAGSIQGDDQGAEQFEQFLLRAFRAAHGAMAPGACIYVSHADTGRLPFTRAFLAAGFKLSQVLIWVKNAATLSRQDYNWRHEPILYGWKEGAGHYFCGDFTRNTVAEDSLNLEKLSKTDLIALVKQIREERATVLHEDKPAKSELHPTMKPVALVRRMLEASTLEHQVVLDPFGGSGTTLIAAEQTNRVARLLEVDPKYCDVIVRRWQEFTGKKAVDAETGLEFGARPKRKPRKAALGVSPRAG